MIKFNKYIILKNGHDKSNLILNTIDIAQFLIIDWYGSDKTLINAYISQGMPEPGIFPCLVDTEEKVIVHSAFDLKDAMERLLKAVEYKNSTDATRYKLNRKYAYNTQGITAEAWAIAIVEKELDGDDTAWKALIAKRNEIRALIPHPESRTNLDIAKSEKKKQILGKTKVIESETFEYLGNTFSSSLAAQANWTSLIADIDSISFPFSIQDVGGNPIPFNTKTDLINCWRTGFAKKAAILAQEASLVYSVESASSIEDVKNIEDTRN